MLASFTLSLSLSNKYDLKVINFNVKIFNYYLETKSATAVSEIIAYLKNANADVICLQEFYNDKNSIKYATIKKMIDIYPYYYFCNDVRNRLGGQFGIVIFSKHKIHNYGEVQFQEKSKNKVSYIEIRLKNQKIRIYNLHLQSMHIDTEQLIESKIDKTTSKNLFYTLKKVKNGMQTRSKQIDAVMNHVASFSGNCIISGDFNDLPYSYTYQKVASNFTNSHVASGNGFGFTFNGLIPFLRIDNQFYNQNLKAVSCKVNRNITNSDHFPLECTYLLK